MREITPKELKILRSSRWLSKRSREFQDGLLALGSVVDLAPEQSLYRRGRVSKYIYGLIEGQIDVLMYASNGEERAAPNRAPGRWLPISDVITESILVSSAYARVPTTTLRIHRSELVRFLDRRPESYREIMTHDNEARQILQTAFANSLATSGEERFAVLLLGLYEAEWLVPGEPVSMSQQEMSALMGSSVPTLQRVLRKLKKQNIVEIQYGKLIVTDLEKLRLFSLGL